MSKVDVKRENEKHVKSKLTHKHKRDAKLQELERQLEFAESRCGTLKQQLDYIKKLYGCRKDLNLEKPTSREEGDGDASCLNQFSFNEISKWFNPNGDFLTRENDEEPEIPKYTISHSNTISTNSSKKFSLNERQETKTLTPKIHVKLLKVKKKNCRKLKKKRKPDIDLASKVSNASSQTQNQIWQDPVVEIYKNSAVNVESESGFEVFGKTKPHKPNEVLSEILRQKVSGNQDQGDPKAKSCNSLNGRKEEGMQTEFPLDQIRRSENKENTQKTESICTEPVKSYCQPTISSKRKQVERDIYNNLTNLNIRNIPFIAAKSTAPSHNIGVNIQQVLSIIKKRHILTDNLLNSNENPNQENPLLALISSRKIGKTTETISAPPTGMTSSSELKKRNEETRTCLSHWKSNSEISREKPSSSNDKPQEENPDWSLKVDKLKKVLVFLHEDFTSLSQKYKRLQKKLTKRNITKTDAKDELADIERDLEKKEEEITVVIALYKEVLNLREELKKLEEKYNFVTCGKALMIDGLKQSNSAHVQMTSLLRKIQNFQDKLKG